MGWSTDDTARPVTPDLNREVGRLDGRMQAMESRIERHEDDVRSRLDKMDGKLDEIQETLAKAAGERSSSSSIGHWVLAAITALAAWFHVDIGHIFRSGGS